MKLFMIHAVGNEICGCVELSTPNVSLPRSETSIQHSMTTSDAMVGLWETWNYFARA